VRLTLLVTSPRVAPGLMSWGAWQAVGSTPRRLASDLDAPVARAVTAVGHEVRAASPDVRELVGVARESDVLWLADDAEADRLPGEVARLLVEEPDLADEVEVEVLHGSYDVPGARLLDLVTVMDELRRSCPWDQEQTHESLARYLLEEAYETLEAIEARDHTHLREELGDLLLQVYFHARIAAESAPEDGGFTIDDVAGDIVDKLVSRHPHVFGGVDVADAAEVEANWEQLKAAEKGRSSVLEGVPMAMPALALADKVVAKAAKVGVAPEPVPVAPDPGETLGGRLLALVVEARAAGVDPEQALRTAVRRLAEAVRTAEAAPPSP